MAARPGGLATARAAGLFRSLPGAVRQDRLQRRGRTARRGQPALPHRSAAGAHRHARGEDRGGAHAAGAGHGGAHPRLRPGVLRLGLSPGRAHRRQPNALRPTRRRPGNPRPVDQIRAAPVPARWRPVRPAPGRLRRPLLDPRARARPGRAPGAGPRPHHPVHLDLPARPHLGEPVHRTGLRPPAGPCAALQRQGLRPVRALAGPAARGAWPEPGAEPLLLPHPLPARRPARPGQPPPAGAAGRR